MSTCRLSIRADLDGENGDGEDGFATAERGATGGELVCFFLTLDGGLSIRADLDSENGGVEDDFDFATAGCAGVWAGAADDSDRGEMDRGPAGKEGALAETGEDGIDSGELAISDIVGGRIEKTSFREVGMASSGRHACPRASTTVGVR
ncbi:MAG TPA: hypothetical protein VKR06_09710 [Ktedonosporobacter sp.]|nr:hypothetical protein [Ktedonosporobacter sp.]